MRWFRFSCPDPTMATLPIAPAVRRLIQVKGIVQGVGFRPFVYALAQSLSLTGHVFNTSAGVTIEIEGEVAAVDHFLRELSANPPYLAELAGVSVREIRTARRCCLLHPDQQGPAWRICPGLARRGHLRCMLGRRGRSTQPPLRLPVHQLHTLWPALHHHPRRSL